MQFCSSSHDVDVSRRAHHAYARRQLREFCRSDDLPLGYFTCQIKITFSLRFYGNYNESYVLLLLLLLFSRVTCAETCTPVRPALSALALAQERGKLPRKNSREWYRAGAYDLEMHLCIRLTARAVTIGYFYICYYMFLLRVIARVSTFNDGIASMEYKRPPRVNEIGLFIRLSLRERRFLWSFDRPRSPHSCGAVTRRGSTTDIWGKDRFSIFVPSRLPEATCIAVSNIDIY